jgi:hypothetical protein
MIRVIETTVGAALVAVSLLDQFRTLFHPEAHGAISDLISRGVWKTFRKIPGKKALMFAGPVAIASVIGSWVLLIVLGFALFYRPRLDLFAGATRGLLDALDVSLGSLITLSGPISPKQNWVHIVTSCEAVIGFGLLTASISWLLSIYPVLG